MLVGVLKPEPVSDMRFVGGAGGVVRREIVNDLDIPSGGGSSGGFSRCKIAVIGGPGYVYESVIVVRYGMLLFTYVSLA